MSVVEVDDTEAPAVDKNPDPAQATATPAVGATLCPRCRVGELINGMCPGEVCTYPAKEDGRAATLREKLWEMCPDSLSSGEHIGYGIAVANLESLLAAEEEQVTARPIEFLSFCDYCEKHVEPQSFVANKCDPCRTADMQRDHDAVVTEKQSTMTARHALSTHADALGKALGMQSSYTWDTMLKVVRNLTEFAKTKPRTPRHRGVGRTRAQRRQRPQPDPRVRSQQQRVAEGSAPDVEGEGHVRPPARFPVVSTNNQPAETTMPTNAQDKPDAQFLAGGIFPEGTKVGIATDTQPGDFLAGDPVYYEEQAYFFVEYGKVREVCIIENYHRGKQRAVSLMVKAADDMSIQLVVQARYVARTAVEDLNRWLEATGRS